jgi:hypothetical protein
MQRERVSSSQIDAVGYDPATKTMEVEFSTGAVYEYYEVSPEVHKSFVTSSSVGRYFGSAIRDNYEFKRL